MSRTLGAAKEIIKLGFLKTWIKCICTITKRFTLFFDWLLLKRLWQWFEVWKKQWTLKKRLPGVRDTEESRLPGVRDTGDSGLPSVPRTTGIRNSPVSWMQGSCFKAWINPRKVAKIKNGSREPLMGPGGVVWWEKKPELVPACEYKESLHPIHTWTGQPWSPGPWRCQKWPPYPSAGWASRPPCPQSSGPGWFSCYIFKNPLHIDQSWADCSFQIAKSLLSNPRIL